MRVINEIMTYNGLLNNEEELFEKMQEITNEANSRVCQAIGIPPILVFKKEKEHLLPLPNDKICSYYKNTTIHAKVNFLYRSEDSVRAAGTKCRMKREMGHQMSCDILNT